MGEVAETLAIGLKTISAEGTVGKSIAGWNEIKLLFKVECGSGCIVIYAKNLEKLIISEHYEKKSRV